MVKIKHCSSNVKPSVSNDKQFFWDITDKEVNHRLVLSEYGFLKTNELDSNIVNDIKLYDKTQTNIEKYVGYDEELYLIHVKCDKREVNKDGKLYNTHAIYFLLSFEINRLIENSVIGRHQYAGRNTIDMFWTKENGKYITYVIVNSSAVEYKTQLSQLHE
tara:strand:+ start:245 stop:727 length:483 start_codon:yes stop_codon:yes gene_type:complete